MAKYSKNSVLLTRVIPVALMASLIACAAPRTKVGAQRDPFADPSKFESLASNAYESPIAASPTTQPVAVVPQNSFSSDSLISGATAFHGTETFTPSIESGLTTRSLAATPVETPMTPELAFSNLVRGNDRFVTGATKGDHRDEARRRSLASSQKPSTIILSCSDSRVPPELIFDQGLGDIFTIRVAGNILGSAQVASIEYAIEHLGAKLVVVLGHESCGAVKAALDSKPKISSWSTDLDWLVSAIKPNIKGREIASIGGVKDPKIKQPVMANVDAVSEQLMVRSHIVSHAMGEGHLKVVRGIYSLESGKVEFWGLK